MILLTVYEKIATKTAYWEQIIDTFIEPKFKSHHENILLVKC